MSDVSNSTSDIPLKQCSRKENCVHPLGAILPATPEFFYRTKRSSDGLSAHCKACGNAYSSKYRENHREEAKEKSRQWRTENIERSREGSRRYQREHPEQVKLRRKRYFEENADKVKKKRASFRQQNRERLIAKDRKRYAENGDRLKAAKRQQYQKSPEKFRDRNREWRASNPEKVRITNQNMRARQRGLVMQFTNDDWKRALDYFNECCAYCGEQRDFWHTIEADHFIPLASPMCVGTTASNMIPACRSCNSSKSASDPVEWLNRKFGKRKAAQILKRINAYFEWVKEQDGEG